MDLICQKRQDFLNVETSLKKMHIIEAVLAILANCMLASLGSKKQSNTIINEQPYIALLTRLRKSLPCRGFLSLPSCIVHVCTRLMHAYKNVPAQHDEWCEYMTWHIMASNDQSSKSQRFWPTSKGRSLYDWDPLGQVSNLVCGILCIYMNQQSSMHHQADMSGSSPAYLCPTHVYWQRPQLELQTLHVQSKWCCLLLCQQPQSWMKGS